MTAFFARTWHSGQLMPYKGLSKSAMTFDLTQLSPRGWAAVIVVTGTVIAVPFMRSGENAQQPVAVPSAASGPRYASQHPLQGLSNPTAEKTASVLRNDATSFQLPPPGSIRSPSVHSSPTTVLSPSSVSSQLPVEPAFPDWARKPSPLDSLIETPSVGNSNVTPEAPLRKPTPFRTWSSEGTSDENMARTVAEPIDRYSPFSEKSHPNSAQSPELAQVAWPDRDWSDQRVAERIEQKRLPSAELVRSRSPLEAATPIGGPAVTVTEEFPEQRKAVGAALRSNVVPSRELFILQPGLQN